MIQVTQDTTHIKGRKLDLAVEITALMHHTIQEHIFTKDELVSFVDLASKSNEELDAESKQKSEELEQKVAEMPEPIAAALNELFGFLM